MTASPQRGLRRGRSRCVACVFIGGEYGTRRGSLAARTTSPLGSGAMATMNSPFAVAVSAMPGPMMRGARTRSPSRAADTNPPVLALHVHVARPKRAPLLHVHDGRRRPGSALRPIEVGASDAASATPRASPVAGSTSRHCGDWPSSATISGGAPDRQPRSVPRPRDAATLGNRQSCLPRPCCR